MQLIDLERLDMLRMLAEDDPDFLNTVIDAYLPQLEKSPLELRDAFAARDPEALVRAAHSLKGSSSNLGAQAVCDVCKKIEDIARKGGLDGIDGLLDKLTPLVRQTYDYFKAQKTEAAESFPA